MPCLFRIFFDVIRDALYQGMGEAFLQSSFPPRIFFYFPFFLRLHCLGECEQALGRIRAAIQQNILDKMEEVLRNFFVNRELPRVHDAHVEAGLDRAIQKRGVHRFPHHVVPAERKRNIADSSAHLRVGQRSLDLPRRFDEIHGVVVVFFYAGRHSQNVRIKNNVFRSDAGLLGKDPVRSPAHLQLSRERIRLAFLIERHHYHGRAVPADQTGALPEGFFALFQAD